MVNKSHERQINVVFIKQVNEWIKSEFTGDYFQLWISAATVGPYLRFYLQQWASYGTKVYGTGRLIVLWNIHMILSNVLKKHCVHVTLQDISQLEG